ncbi:MAG: ABC transporter substrate-binding protein [Deltaproteobacteria bacterium]|nr:ABC transporter substrate-binding protein [Deltaproteobacteria bacterium]
MKSLLKALIFSTLLHFVHPALHAAAAPNRVNIGTASLSSNTVSLWIAQEQGFFAKHGVEAQIIAIRGGPTLVASLVAGEIHLAFTSGVSVLGAAVQGIDIKLLTSISNRVSWKMVASPTIKRPEDLKGKRFGIQSIVGSTWMYTMLGLEHMGLEPKRDHITFVVIGDPVTIGHALEAGRIDAAVLDPVLVRRLMRKGFALVADLASADIYFPGLGVGVTRVYLRQRADRVEKIVAALVESLAFVASPANKAVVLKTLMKHLRISDPAVAEEGYQEHIVSLNRKAYPSLEGLRNVQRLMALQNPKVATLKVEELIDDRFIRKLDESGFLDRAYKSYPAK